MNKSENKTSQIETKASAEVLNSLDNSTKIMTMMSDFNKKNSPKTDK